MKKWKYLRNGAIVHQIEEEKEEASDEQKIRNYQMYYCKMQH